MESLYSQQKIENLGLRVPAESWHQPEKGKERTDFDRFDLSEDGYIEESKASACLPIVNPFDYDNNAVVLTFRGEVFLFTCAVDVDENNERDEYLFDVFDAVKESRLGVETGKQTKTRYVSYGLSTYTGLDYKTAGLKVKDNHGKAVNCSAFYRTGGYGSYGGALCFAPCRDLIADFNSSFPRQMSPFTYSAKRKKRDSIFASFPTLSGILASGSSTKQGQAPLSGSSMGIRGKSGRRVDAIVYHFDGERTDADWPSPLGYYNPGMCKERKRKEFDHSLQWYRNTLAGKSKDVEVERELDSESPHCFDLGVFVKRSGYTKQYTEYKEGERIPGAIVKTYFNRRCVVFVEFSAVHCAHGSVVSDGSEQPPSLKPCASKQDNSVAAREACEDGCLCERDSTKQLCFVPFTAKALEEDAGKIESRQLRAVAKGAMRNLNKFAKDQHFEGLACSGRRCHTIQKACSRANFVPYFLNFAHELASLNYGRSSLKRDWEEVEQSKWYCENCKRSPRGRIDRNKN